MKLFGVLFLAALGFWPWYIFGHAWPLFSACIGLMLATAFLDGVSVIDLENARLRRTVRLLWLVPVWSRTHELSRSGELHVTFRPSWRDRWNKWHERDFTVIDLRFGPRDWLQLAQTDRSRGNFDETLLARARELAQLMRLRMVVSVERVSSAVEHRDDSHEFPPPELRDNNTTCEDART